MYGCIVTIELQYRKGVVFNNGLDQYTLLIESKCKGIRYPLFEACYVFSQINGSVAKE